MVLLSKQAALALQLNEKDRLAITGLIDLKTEDDMEKVLNRLDAMESKFDARFEAIDAKFEAIDAKFEAMDAKFEAKFEAMDAKFGAIDTRFESLEKRFSDFRWFIGGGFTLIGILIAVLQLY